MSLHKMLSRRIASPRAIGLCCVAVLVSGSTQCRVARSEQPAPIPEVHQLIREVREHQKQLEKVRENYTYSSSRTIQDIDANGQVKKTESEEYNDFFVNGHMIERMVKKDGKALSEHEEQKETERATKLVEKAEKTPTDQALDEQAISVSRVLELMDVRNPRRDNLRGRPALVFDFVGRKDARTHGMAEDASKKLQGSIWIDEADRQVAHLEVTFNDNFRVAGGLIATIDKGSNFRFDQAPVNGEIWLPTGGEGTMQARVLMVKNYRQHFFERDYDYKRFRVETQLTRDSSVAPDQKHN